MNALELCTDAAAMAALLQRSLPGFGDGQARIESLRVHKVRRSSSIARNPHPITLCWELSVREGSCRGSLWLYAKMFRDGASAACFASIDAAQLERPLWGDAVMHLPALDMVLWAMPNDPGLPQLAAMLDPVQLHPLLPWAALGIDPARARGLDVELLRHEPERRATLRCTLALDGSDEPLVPQSLVPQSLVPQSLVPQSLVPQSLMPQSLVPQSLVPQSLVPPSLVLYAKTFDDTRGRAIDERFDHFWRLAQDDDAAPLVARPLGWDARTNTVWQANASGTPLREALAAPGADAGALLARVALALARLHAAPLAASRERALSHWVAEARRRRTKIERAEPAARERVHALVERLEVQAAQLRPRPLSLIHGDFHPDQVWLREGRVVLFDFDEFTLGDPLEDVAEFATKLDDDAHRRAFIAAFAAQPGAGVDDRALRWHLAIQALLQASRAFVFQRPGWRADLERWLEGAEAHTEPRREESFA